MPLFDTNDFDSNREEQLAGMVDLTYVLSVENSLICALEHATQVHPHEIEWLACNHEQLLASWRIPLSHSNDDSIAEALLLSSIGIVRNLLGFIHEESVPGLLKHLAFLHDKLDHVEAPWIKSIHPRLLLSQLVLFTQPTDDVEAQHAFMRIIDYAYDDEEEMIENAAIAVARYMMFISLVVLSGEEKSSNDELLCWLKNDHRERASEPVVPYFESVESDPAD